MTVSTDPPPAPPRPGLRRSVLWAAGALWLPTTVPFAVGPLTECSHCVETYLKCIPILPGVLPATLLRGEDVIYVLIAGAATLALLLAMTALVRVAGRFAWIPLVAVAVWSGLQAVGFSHALRA